MLTVRAIGIATVALGTLLMAAGLAYALERLVFGGAIFAWTLMCGSMMVGVGALAANHRSLVVATGGTLACSLSLLLIYEWQTSVGDLELWLWLWGGPAACGAAFGVVSVVRSVLARRKRSSTALSDPSPESHDRRQPRR
jgi:hypothetical protein